MIQLRTPAHKKHAQNAADRRGKTANEEERIFAQKLPKNVTIRL
jgi:hypothetical protein